MKYRQSKVANGYKFLLQGSYSVPSLIKDLGPDLVFIYPLSAGVTDGRTDEWIYKRGFEDEYSKYC